MPTKEEIAAALAENTRLLGETAAPEFQPPDLEPEELEPERYHESRWRTFMELLPEREKRALADDFRFAMARAALAPGYTVKDHHRAIVEWQAMKMGSAPPDAIDGIDYEALAMDTDETRRWDAELAAGPPAASDPVKPDPDGGLAYAAWLERQSR